MGTIFVPYPYPNRGIPHGLAGIGSPLTSLFATVAGTQYSQSHPSGLMQVPLPLFNPMAQLLAHTSGSQPHRAGLGTGSSNGADGIRPTPSSSSNLKNSKRVDQYQLQRIHKNRNRSAQHTSGHSKDIGVRT
jgi:hypothetical protein